MWLVALTFFTHLDRSQKKNKNVFYLFFYRILPNNGCECQANLTTLASKQYHFLFGNSQCSARENVVGVLNLNYRFWTALWAIKNWQRRRNGSEIERGVSRQLYTFRVIFLDLKITTVDEENVVYYINIKPTRYRVIRIIKSSIRVFMGAAMFFFGNNEKAEEGLLLLRCYGFDLI